jgi:hypothetical protein
MFWFGWREYCWSQHGYFSGLYCVSRTCLEFPTLGDTSCKLISVTDLHLGSARFPVTVTTVCRGLEGKLCTNLFLCNWLVFLTTCEPSTANPWLHHPPGVHNPSPDSDGGSGLSELISSDSASIINSCFLQSGLGDFVSLTISCNKSSIASPPKIT